MNRYHFSHHLKIGVPGIDAQHEKTAILLQSLARALSEGDTATPLFRMEELLDFTHDHFQDEERLLADAGYSSLLEHKRQHAYLSSQLRKLNVRLAFYDRVPSPNVLDSLWIWFGRHVVKADRIAADWACARFPGQVPIL